MTIEKGPEVVKEFVDELGEAMAEEDRSVRETILDKSGGFRKAKFYFADDKLNCTEDVFVDTLGRIIVPPEQKYQELQHVEVIGINGGDNELQEVVKLESRYENEYISAFVIYLEAME